MKEKTSVRSCSEKPLGTPRRRRSYCELLTMAAAEDISADAALAAVLSELTLKRPTIKTTLKGFSL